MYTSHHHTLNAYITYLPSHHPKKHLRYLLLPSSPFLTLFLRYTSFCRSPLPSIFYFFKYFYFSFHNTIVELASMSIEPVDSLVIEIGDEDQQKSKMASTAIVTVMDHHPLMEISNSSGHLLLLKLWQREEHLFGKRAGVKEGRLDSIRGEIFQLACFFFIFHALFITILFGSTSSNSGSSGKKWWIPAMISLSTSLLVVGLVQAKIQRYFMVKRQLESERSGLRGLARCVQELRMKGASFDLSKDIVLGNRSNWKKAKIVKCWSVEEKWKVITWCGQNMLTILLLLFSGSLFPISRLILS